MSFLKDLIGDFAGNNKRQNEGPPGYYPQQQQYDQSQSSNGPPYPQQQPYGQSQSSNGPPQVPPPWIAEWDARDNRWLYVNRETGERTFEYPQARGNSDRGNSSQEEPRKASHTGRNVALGAVAGLAGGALLMHEGKKVG